MSMRYRTEIIRVTSGTIATVALAGGAAIHGVWAAGSTWPAASSGELADLVVGRRPMPGRAPCAMVAVALAGAAAATALTSTGDRAASARWSRAAATVVSSVLLARGVGGAVAESCHIGQVTPEFRRWNRRLYSPLCLMLGILVAVARWSRK